MSQSPPHSTNHLDQIQLDIPDESDHTPQDLYNALYNSNIQSLSPVEDPQEQIQNENRIITPLDFENFENQSQLEITTPSRSTVTPLTPIPRPPTPFTILATIYEDDDEFELQFSLHDHIYQHFGVLAELYQQPLTFDNELNIRNNPIVLQSSTQRYCPVHSTPSYRNQSQNQPIEPANSPQISEISSSSSQDSNDMHPPSNFNISTFHKVIPAYDGKPSALNIFLNRCDTYYHTLNALGRFEFLANIIYKLDDTAWHTLFTRLNSTRTGKLSEKIY